MRPETEVTCDYCGKIYTKPIFRVRENEKNGWKNYCSRECQAKFYSKSKVFICSNPDCDKKVIRKPSKVEPSGNVFCSHSCAAAVTNKTRVVKSRKYKTTKPQDLPECKYEKCHRKVSTKYKKYCSMKCYGLDHRKPPEHFRKKAISGIRSFYKQHGRIPMKREVYRLYQPARRAFGTWNNAIQAAGYQPNPVQFAKQYIAKDGHRCDSMSERIIDDWLYNRRIPHQINVKYPWRNGMTVDFKSADFWIEFFGLDGHLEVYDQLKDKKLKLAEKYQLDVLAIYPKDLVNNKLSLKLKPVLDYFSQRKNVHQPSLFNS